MKRITLSTRIENHQQGLCMVVSVPGTFLILIGGEISRQPSHDRFKFGQSHLMASLSNFNGCSVVSGVFEASECITVLGFQSFKFIRQLCISYFIEIQPQPRVFRHLSLGTCHGAIWSKDECANGETRHQSAIPLSTGYTGKNHGTKKNLEKHHEVVAPAPEGIQILLQSVAIENVEFLLVACHVKTPIVVSAVAEGVVAADEGSSLFFLLMGCIPASSIPSNNRLVAYAFYWLLGGPSTKEASLRGLVYKNRAVINKEVFCG